ncbi:MAG: hypothetical protein DIU65_12505 [Proteobacteria bacterium]|nr:MAG: hypothetical protein DIU65_12505 [Pseudomonadota bacterium]
MTQNVDVLLERLPGSSGCAFLALRATAQLLMAAEHIVPFATQFLTHELMVFQSFPSLLDQPPQLIEPLSDGFMSFIHRLAALRVVTPPQGPDPPLFGVSTR